MLHIVVFQCVLAITSLSSLNTITLENTKLPTDTNGAKVISGEVDVLTVEDKDGKNYYVYINNWGTCKCVDCCPSAQGCASCCYVPPSPAFPDPCVFVNNHTVEVYRTTDFASWEYKGVALQLANRPQGIEFRPHVVYNQASNKYVMWFEDRPTAIVSSGYFVATSSTPEGPFVTIKSNISVADVPGDFDILVDSKTGNAYHVQTTTNDPNKANGFAVTLLNEDFTGPTSKHVTFSTPAPSEGPVFFQRADEYYILCGTTCCACRGGSSVYVYKAPTPLGPWEYRGDIGSNTSQTYDPNSPTNYITHAQGSTVFEINNEFIWLGNQWVTGPARNADLFYFAKLIFNESLDIAHFQWHDNITISL
eukprot:m.345456 g.345456  ORF g.345456 m.345456 type:complete len:364 (-) comp26482_c0_seq1:23-1114(-)